MAYLAIDLGAGSGRVIAGELREGSLSLTEIHRFPNRPEMRNGTWYWNWSFLYEEILAGIRRAVEQGFVIDGIGVDTWGVDFGLVGPDGLLLDDPVCYRDDRTVGMSQVASEYLSPSEWYETTGIQQMEINTAYQLMSSLRKKGPSSYPQGTRLLFMPDLVNYLLTGALGNEYTIASTSQMLDARSRQWSIPILDRLGIPETWVQPIVAPGTCLGFVTSEIAARTGAHEARVFAVGSHDTASAVAALPASGADWAFLSCGTWSLLGVTSNEPILTAAAMSSYFTNEGGVADRILFLRNITGLWLLQRLMFEWEELGTTVPYDRFAELCASCAAFRSLVDVDAPLFKNPPSMSAAIGRFCRETDQPEPTSPGEFIRCVLESLAMKYRSVLESLQCCTGRTIKRLHVVGGGSRNEVLVQFVADATGLEVTTGLTEATAVGNIIQQAIAAGAVSGWSEGHGVVARSFAFRTYRPQHSDKWISAYSKYQKLIIR